VRLATRARTSAIRPTRLRFAKAAGILSPITFPATPLTFRVEIALGADPGGDPVGWLWQDITAWVRQESGAAVVFGRRDEAATVDASSARLTLDNRDGRFARRNPYGPYYGLLSKNTPIRIGVDPGDGVHYRYHGFVTEWPTRWTDESGSDSTVPIACAGVLRRLTRDGRIGSALTRAMAGVSEGDFQPIAHWPAEDGSGAARLGSTIAGVSPANVSGDVTLAGFSGFAGSDPLPVLGDGGTLHCSFPPYTSTGVWQIQFGFMIPSDFASSVTLANIFLVGGNAVARFQLIYDATFNDLRLTALDAAGTSLDTSSGSNGIVFGTGYIAAITDFALGPRSTILSVYTTSGFLLYQISIAPGGSPGMPAKLRARGTSVSSGWSIGQIALYTDPAVVTAPNIGPNAAAAGGYVGETATDRMIRLCREEGFPFTCTSATSIEMGAQISGTLLANLRDCESADMGVLYEHEFGLGYQSLDDRINAPVQLALDFDQAHIAGTPEPADDDQRTANRVVASRPSGSSYLDQDSDSIASDGLYDVPASANVETDLQLPDVAGTVLHRGTIDEDRWPSLPINLTRTPDLISGWTALPYGSRVTAANPPSQVAPDAIDAVVEGHTEFLSPYLWTASLNTSPATAYKVGRIAAESGDTSDDAGRLEADSCTLAADVTSADTTWSVNTTPLASTAADDAGFLIRFGGEVIRVNTITGVANPQTWSVDRAVNGVSKAQTAGTPGALVRPFMPTT
jgi:hypothetical protein